MEKIGVSTTDSTKKIEPIHLRIKVMVFLLVQSIKVEIAVSDENRVLTSLPVGDGQASGGEMMDGGAVGVETKTIDGKSRVPWMKPTV
ncbi:Hypothetical predicted protein [Olea europaea subsp. europaea]|uniref:Uncharacterized protein n=1 Tax=Olea europaea subsp. europaea TaxID=158383 RepID=A0A8S0U343_OLEEU|nr:Hypothetical predicted protein [Olea europaea subsp. europaea]